MSVCQSQEDMQLYSGGGDKSPMNTEYIIIVSVGGRNRYVEVLGGTVFGEHAFSFVLVVQKILSEMGCGIVW